MANKISKKSYWTLSVNNMYFCLQFQEVLEIHSATSTLHMTLCGRGVSPIVNLSVEGHQLDMGAVIAGEYREETFKVGLNPSCAVLF